MAQGRYTRKKFNQVNAPKILESRDGEPLTHHQHFSHRGGVNEMTSWNMSRHELYKINNQKSDCNGYYGCVC